VLWSMTLAPALKTTGIGGALYIVAMFYMFFTLSCIILIVMEGVSAMVCWPPLPPFLTPPPYFPPTLSPPVSARMTVVN